MRLAEALLEKTRLQTQLKLLESRISHDLDMGRGTSQIQEEVQRKANLLRDISIAIDWTEQNSLLSGLPLGSYRIRVSCLKELARILEPVNREKADSFSEAAHNDEKFIEAAIWLIDLQIPKIDNKEDP